MNYYNNPNSVNTDMPQGAEQPYFYRQNDQPMSVGDWMITMLIMAIPLVGLVMLFVWAFGSEANISKRNFAKASLIWMAIAIVLWFVLFATLFASLMSTANSFNA